MMSASSRMTVIPSSLMSSRRPTNGERRLAPALAARSPWLAEKISVQFVLIPSSAKRLIASRPFSLIATLTTMLGASFAKWRPSASIPSTSSAMTSALTGPGVEAGVRGDAVYHAPADRGPDLIDVGGVEEELHVGRLHVMFVAMSLRRLGAGEPFRACRPALATA